MSYYLILDIPTIQMEDGDMDEIPDAPEKIPDVPEYIEIY